STPPQTHVPSSSSAAPPPRPSHSSMPPPFFFFFVFALGSSSKSRSSPFAPLLRGRSSSGSSLSLEAPRARGLSATPSSSLSGLRLRSPGTERTAWHFGQRMRLPAKRSSMFSSLSHSSQARLIGMASLRDDSHSRRRPPAGRASAFFFTRMDSNP